MKYLLTAALLYTLALGSSLNAQTYENLKVVPFETLSEEQAKNLLRGDEDEVAIQIPEGTLLPVKLFLGGDIIEFHQNQEIAGTLEVKQTFYITNEDDLILCSTDLLNWAPLNTFLTGSVYGGINLDDDYPVLTIGAYVDVRDSE